MRRNTLFLASSSIPWRFSCPWGYCILPCTVVCDLRHIDKSNGDPQVGCAMMAKSLYPFHRPRGPSQGRQPCECAWGGYGREWDPHEEFSWPIRCSMHNIELKRWQRGRDWRIGVHRTRKNAPKGKRRVFLLTLTEKHQPYPRRVWHANGETWSDQFVADSIATHKSRIMKTNAQRLMRSAAWKRNVHGSLWALECTVRPTARCPLLEQARLTSDGTPLRIRESQLGWSIHPHIHAVVVGSRWDLDELRALSEKYGFSAAPDISMCRNISASVNYVCKYATKDQPVGRSHNTTGAVRDEVRLIRLERSNRSLEREG